MSSSVIRYGWSSAVLVVVVAASASAHAGRMEADEVTIQDTFTSTAWTVVPFQQTFDITPLVFVYPSDQGGDPCHTRIRNVTTTEFEVICAEPTGNDGAHVAMDTYYFAIEPGVHDLDDGTRIEAGIISTDEEQSGTNITTPASSYRTVQNTRSVPGGTPAVLGMVQTIVNGTNNAPDFPLDPWLTVAIEDVTNAGLDIALERSEVDDLGISFEDEIGYVVWPDGTGSFTDDDGFTVDYDAFTTSSRPVVGWDDTPCQTVAFTQTFTATTRLVLASKVTRFGNNGGWLRRCGTPTATGADFAVDEDVANDSERSHVGEDVSLLVFSRPFVETALTRATIQEVVAWADPTGRVFVDFETSAELGTVGFELLRWSETVSRPVDGASILVEPGRIGGASYRFVDPDAHLGERVVYHLKEREADGGVVMHGPFEVVVTEPDYRVDLSPSDAASARRVRPLDMGTVVRASRSVSERLDRHYEREAFTTPLAWRSFPALKILTPRSGGVAIVHAAALARAWTLPVAIVERWITDGDLDLLHRGRPVTYVPRNDLMFWARPLDDLDNPANVYWLAVDPGRVSAPARPLRRRPSGTPQTSFSASLRLEEDALPLTAVARAPGASDFWHWHGFAGADPRYASEVFTLSIPHPVGTGPADLRVRMVGVSDAAHEVEVRLGSRYLGVVQGRGFKTFEQTFALDPSWLGSGRVDVELTALDPEGRASSFAYLEGFDVAYRRRLVLEDGRLEFEAERSGAVRVDGAASTSVLAWDISDADRPRERSVRVDAASTARSVWFNVRRGHRYVVQDLARIRALPSIVVDEPSRLRSWRNAADYLMIVPGFLEKPAIRLAKHRRSQGLRVVVARLEDIYDEFNDGLEGPEVIRDFLVHVADTWSTAPRQVVIVGAGHFDALDRLGFGRPSVPTLLVDRPGEGLFVSDPAFAARDPSGGFRQLVGRLPVSSASELDRLVEKIQDFERRGPSGHPLLIADNHRRGDNFSLDVQRLEDGLSTPVETVLYEGQSLALARSRILTAWGRAPIVSYVGHGGFDRFSNDGLLRVGDLPALPIDTYPVVIASTCLANGFFIPEYEALGAALVRAPDRGAIAMYAPTAMSDNGDAVRLNEAILRELQTPSRTLGDVLQEAIEDYLSTGHRPHLVELYTLLGDPGLRLP